MLWLLSIYICFENLLPLVGCLGRHSAAPENGFSSTLPPTSSRFSLGCVGNGRSEVSSQKTGWLAASLQATEHPYPPGDGASENHREGASRCIIHVLSTSYYRPLLQGHHLPTPSSHIQVPSSATKSKPLGLPFKIPPPPSTIPGSWLRHSPTPSETSLPASRSRRHPVLQ